MKRTTTYLIACMLLAIATNSYSQGTAFTYQGRLNVGANPATGVYDLRFALYDAATSGAQQGVAVTNTPTAVSNGLFTVTLDFGSQFPGANRWLEIGARTNGSSAFTTLTPRQPLTSSPYAITAGKLTGVIAASQLPANAVTNNATGLNLTGSFSGNGANVTNVNAVTLNGVSSAGFWRTNGNAGADSANGAFLGTTDNLPLELKVNGQRALRLEPTYNGQANVIGGSATNYVGPGGSGMTLGGGYANSIQNSSSYSTIGGGINNTIQSSPYATIGGGNGNTMQSPSDSSAIGGGQGNTIQANSLAATIGGGYSNTIQVNASFATIPGGYLNSATTYSFAAGRRAKANHTGAFVWADSQDADFASTNSNQFNVRANGGVRLVTSGAGLAVDGQPVLTAGVGLGIALRNSSVASGAQSTSIGVGSRAEGPASTALGDNTTASGDTATAMGESTTASGTFSTALGYSTTASGYASLALGRSTTAGGYAATALGLGSVATNYSFAAGSYARALHDGSFVWADRYNYVSNFDTTATNQFLIRAASGVGINMNHPDGASLYVQGERTNGWQHSVGYFENTSAATNVAPALRVVNNSGTSPDGALSVSAVGSGLIAEFGNANAFVVTITNDGTIYSKGLALTSDRNAKENFTILDAKTVLAKVAALPVTQWNYKDDGLEKKHIGPVAQDFQAAFGLNGGDDRHISVVDEGGVALAAIQGLNEKIEARSQKSEDRTRMLEDRLAQKETEISELKQRLAALEKIILN